MRTDFHHKIQRSATWLLVLIPLAFGCSMVFATVYTANFDDLSGGFVGASFSDGGLTFSDLDGRLPGVPLTSYEFAIQPSTGLPPPFSSPNVLAFNAYGIGGSGAFGRFGSAWIDFSGIGTSASMDVFEGVPPPGEDSWKNTLSLEAWNGSTMVASVSTSFANSSTTQESSLVLNNVAPFDRLELYSSGPVDYGILLIDVDNVSVTTVPEPSELSLLTLGLVGGIYLRRMQPKNISKLRQQRQSL